MSKAILNKCMNDANKRYGEGTVVWGDQAKSIHVDRVSWGVFSLDAETGGGCPKGRIIQIQGPYSSGKTSLALKLAAQIQTTCTPDKVVWVDAEGAYDPDWYQKLGLDMSKTILVQPNEGPKGLDIAEELVRTKEIGLLVIDSVANIVPLQELEGSIEDQQMGIHARLINKFIRKISMALQPGNLSGKGNPCIVLLLNQERATMDKYNPITTPGGKGKEFAASIMVAIRRGDWIADDETKKPIGHEVHFKVVKNKTFPPKREGSFDFYFSDNKMFKAGEIDNDKGIVGLAVERFLIERAGAMFRYGNKSFRGYEQLVEHFYAHPKEKEELRRLLLELTPKRGELVVSDRKIKINLTKVKK